MVCARGKGRKVKGKTHYNNVHLSNEQRMWVEGFLACETINAQIKVEISKIQERFGQKFGRDIKPQTISRIRKSLALLPMPSVGISPQNRSKIQTRGRKRITTAEEDQLIIDTIEAFRRSPWIEIAKILKSEHQIDISVDTLIRRANEDGIRGYVPYEKPLLNQDKAQKRLAFAKRMKKILEKDPDFLHCIVFTDETKIHFFENGIGGNVHVRCRSNERLDHDNVKGSVKYGGGGITFWGSISYKRIGRLITFDQNLTGQIYSDEVLRGALVQSLDEMEMEIGEALIQEDLDPKHSLRCKISQETAEEMGYNILQDYPPSSPDLNPIEHVWSLLKCSVARRNPSTKEELEAFSQEEWLRFGAERSKIVKSLINSFPRRLDAVIEKNGWYTDY